LDPTSSLAYVAGRPGAMSELIVGGFVRPNLLLNHSPCPLVSNLVLMRLPDPIIPSEDSSRFHYVRVTKFSTCIVR